MRALLIVNPNATSTTAAGRDVLARALSTALELRVAHTDHRGHAAELAAQAVADGAELVVVHGGDGTINEAVNGMLGAPGRAGGPGPALAVVPGGSANVFARSLGISDDPMEATRQLLAAVSSGARRPVGLGIVDDRWFTCNAGLGWDAEVVAVVERHRERGRSASPGRYFRSAFTGYLRTRRHGGRLRAQFSGPGGEQIVPDLHAVFVCATDPWTYLGQRAVRTNPGIRHDGGLGFFGLTSLGLPTLAKVLPAMLRADGDPKAPKLVRCDDASWIRVECGDPADAGTAVDLQVDGDHLGPRSVVEFRRVPDALQVVTESGNPAGDRSFGDTL